MEINAAATAADLAVSYAAALGGMATLTGTGTYCTVQCMYTSVVCDCYTQYVKSYHKLHYLKVPHSA